MAEREVAVRPLGRSGDLGWVVMAHGEFYDREFGWDTGFEALVSRIVADYAEGKEPGPQAAWIAEVDGVRVAASSASATTTGRRSCACCSSTRARAAWGWEPVWSRRA